jgi:type IV secretory pathway TraG/TraD family ATPase VirD4
MTSMPSIGSDDQPSHRGILLGRDQHGWIWSGHQRSALVLGPTRSGKTTSIIIPNVLSAPGSVVLTSTKHDVIDATVDARRAVGHTLLFDPLGGTPPPPGVEPIGWSPLSAAATWDGAIDMASAMVNAAQRRARGAGGMDHWSERSAALLSALLFAGRAENLPLSGVVMWVDRHSGDEALEILIERAGQDHPATALLTGILATDAREQSGIWSTTSGVLGAYRSLGALASTQRDVLDPGAFVDGAHTLYICASGRSQELAAPLVVGMLSEVRAAAYRRADLDRPVLLALDELANIAPLPDLPQVVSEGGGQGLLTIGCLQDLSQARMRWGPEADGFLSLFSTTLLLGGVADRTTLRAFHDLAGRSRVARVSRSRSPSRRGRPNVSETWSTTDEDVIPLDEVARGRPGHGLLLDATNAVGWVPLTVAHRDQPWVSRTRRRQRGGLTERER